MQIDGWSRYAPSDTQTELARVMQLHFKKFWKQFSRSAFLEMLQSIVQRLDIKERKAKHVPVHSLKAYMGSTSISPLILNHGVRRR